mmetsp:Transcript_83293/g.236036  ORF Transcript_83293/g.236036 Transcript_83293/m.236036 type:complete len:536 (+) Transcript_83293:40-1647(+)|eukprot:CAMPEP_0168368318 /NCGR_PEP_ID=MMETSP0228-20121227/6190_1 /TAXON_ID=133427 /ORGANISM="Protoceratium reticulatum, Strain CCCM 535 (=CCMP 1889)" /LENGTH=535 /DNA_ID=CAMNT_0008381163 /DNA_START=40 /DNA_END=1647 /DNA_ORIENTATION=-
MESNGGRPEHAERCRGTVKSFKGTWGFLVAEGVGGDVFIHLKDSPSLTGSLPRPGDVLEFDLSAGGPNNEARAINASRITADAGGAHSGTVVSFRHGWGLLESPSVEGRLYFGERDNPQLKEGMVHPGDEVTFELASNSADGRMKAVNVSHVVKDQSHCVGQRMRGSVKSFSDGWGFAVCPRFSGTIMLGRKQVTAAGLGATGLQVGDTVEFEVAHSPNGKFESANITKIQPAAPPAHALPPRAAGGWHPPAATPMSMGNGTARDRSRSPYATTPCPPSQQEGRFTGHVKTFRDDWGFIVSDQVEGDVFVKMRDSPTLGWPLQLGEVVSFELIHRPESTRNNGAHAVNVERMAADGAGPVPWRAPAPQLAAWPQQVIYSQQPSMVAPAWGPQAAPMQHSGTVAAFKPAPDNWGWLDSPTCPSQIFFGLRDNPQLTTPPSVGDHLVFELAPGAKGRNKAVNIAPSLVGQRVPGTVRTLKDGWGFASSDVLAGKVMLGKKNLTASGIDASALQVGEMIEFEVSMATKGYEAVNIRML